MRHDRLMNAAKNAGAIVEKMENGYRAVKGNNAIYWYTQESYPDKTKLDAICVHRKSPHTDMMTDCCCDTFFDTIKSAVSSFEW